MKGRLLLCLVCSWVCVARARVLWWGEKPQADQPPGNEGAVADLLQMVEAVSQKLNSMTGDGFGWLSRYQQLAKTLEKNDNATKELLDISRVTKYVLWNIYISNTIIDAIKGIKKGGMSSPHISSLPTPPLLHPQSKFIYIFPTPLMVEDTFVMQASLKTTAEANIGICMYFAPEEGKEPNFQSGDIFFAAHIRWHFAYGNSREIAFNDRYNGEWSRPEVIAGGDKWPDFNVGEKFLISMSKAGPCIYTIIILGRDLHFSRPYMPAPMVFCPQNPRTGDPRKLWLTVNEDKVGAGEVQVFYTLWFPLDEDE